MTRSDTRSFPAWPASIGDAVAFVEACCTAAGVAHDDVLRLVLVTEELFTNTVMHGHAGGADALVQITLRTEADRLLLEYSDAAPAFDPLAWRDAALLQPEPDLAERRPGGLGLLMLLRLASQARHAYEGGRNVLQLELPRSLS